ncbi:MAG: HAMP domain-containing sensor histidine kinase [Pseudomonadota bacterium]
MTRRPHLRTVLLLANTLVLLLPLACIAVMRLYESELIRQTESELIAQGAIVAASYREEVRLVLGGNRQPRPDSQDAASREYGSPVDETLRMRENPDSPLNPLAPKLDRARDDVRPTAEHALPADQPPDAVAVKAALKIQPVLTEAGRVTLAGIRITDFRGTVVASTGSEMGLSLLTRDEVRQALKGRPVSLLRERFPDQPAPPLESISRRTRVRVFAALPVILDERVIGAVILSRTPLDIMKALYLNRFYLLGGGAIVIAAVILVSILTSLTISRPVDALIRQSRQVAAGEQTAAVPLQKPGTYEVDQLSKALASMSVILEKRADYIRAFASNVSHEFKTPLTSMRGTIELLRDHLDEMPRENRDRFLEMLDEDTGRLERLVRRLLDLARADVFRPGNERADVHEILERLVQRCRASGLPADLRQDPKVKSVSMAPETFESVMTNFLDNARRHGGDTVQVRLVTRACGTAESPFVEIEIGDTGKGIPEPDIDKVFKPFFTTARATGGTGLGLSIVDTLVRAHGGQALVVPQERGACFLVRLPAGIADL